jgi:hypothetical protein
VSRIAVDVVLLPDEAMTNLAIRINRQLTGGRRAAIVLNRHDCLPHISLAMGSMGAEDVARAEATLRGLAAHAAVKTLRVVGLASAGGDCAAMTSLLKVETTDGLQGFHSRVMTEMAPLLSREVTAEMVCDEQVATSTLAWIARYREDASFERYDPHITIGFGRVETETAFPVTFQVTRLALCHLGNHCTCRKVLASTTLG